MKEGWIDGSGHGYASDDEHSTVLFSFPSILGSSCPSSPNLASLHLQILVKVED